MQLIVRKDKQDPSIRERILSWLLGKVIPIHTMIYRKRKPWGVCTEDLIQYPSGTLGRELGLFLKERGLQPMAKLERHDVFHVLLGFTTHMSDEAAMYFFLVGNGKLAPFTIGTAIFAGLMLPEHWKYFRTHYVRGRQARSIAQWNFRLLLHDNFEDIRRLVFRQTIYNTMLIQKISGFENSADKTIRHNLHSYKKTFFLLFCFVIQSTFI